MAKLKQSAFKLLLRPEATAVVGTIAVIAYFGVTAADSGFFSAAGIRNNLEVAAAIGIMAAPVTLLLIAGEFDLSVGAVVGLGEFLFAYALVELDRPLWQAIAFAMLGAVIVGLFNGLLVVKTPIPSLIVTLAGLFWIRGFTVGIAQELAEATRISGVKEGAGDNLLASLFRTRVAGLSPSFYWWMVATVIAAWVLSNSRFGNWIYATGGNQDSATRAGVVVGRVKVILYVWSAAAATLVGILESFTINQGNAQAGLGMEFRVAAAVVIGGAAITGGYGSPVGSAIGSLFFGIVFLGFFFTNVPDQWFGVFLGIALLASVLINQYSRQYTFSRYSGAGSDPGPTPSAGPQ